MKIVLNPEYKFLQQFVQDLPTRFASEGKVIQDKRNTIKVFEYKELEINVKRYRVPILINRIAYRFFRKSKAVKAYFNSLEVRKRGFNTPESIACIETFRGGLLHYSYYISLQCPFHKEMRELYFGPLTGNEDLLRAFARYTAALHEMYLPSGLFSRECPGQRGRRLFSVCFDRYQSNEIQADGPKKGM